MKVEVRLAIVLATLLLVSNVAFAVSVTCDQNLCYDITATDQNGNTSTDSWYVCLQNDGTGYLFSLKAGTINLYLFGGGPSWFNTSGSPAFGGNPMWSTWIADNGSGRAGYLQPMPPDGGGLILSGEGHNGGTRWTVRGTKVPFSQNCVIDP
jgi:hypothetical protein